MPSSSNSLPKPKVRFTNSQEGPSASGPFRGPRIREILTLERPIKLIPLPPDQQADNPPANPLSKTPEVQKIPLEPEILILSPPSDEATPERPQKAPEGVGKPPEDLRPDEKLPIDIEALQKKLENLETAGKIQKAPKVVKKSVVSKSNVQTMQKVPSKLILKSKNTPKHLEQVKKPLVAEKKIENKENIDKKGRNLKRETTRAGKSVKIGQKSDDICSDVLKRCSENVGQVKPLGNRKKFVGKKDLGLMPCMKKKIEEKKKIKVDILKNVSRPVPNVFVGPGMPRERSKVPCVEEPEEFRKKVNMISGEQLNRPEYNSIICTIKKLKEIKKKKIIGDFEPLPAVYKELLNEKISSALDFPPCESVYHDLVDISVDEKQLPMRLTRSRDPEPRPKDFVPKLSDFFVPQYADEYSIAVQVRPRTPEIIDYWSGFRINDKINSWTMSLSES